MTKEEKAKMTETELIKKEAKNYEKFQSKVNRLTEYAHTKRMFARMDYQKRKEAEERKGAAGKKKTAS